jgi:Kef-type K+ transport system membrane component KefB
MVCAWIALTSGDCSLFERSGSISRKELALGPFQNPLGLSRRHWSPGSYLVLSSRFRAGRGVGPIVAFLIAGLIVGQIGALPPEPVQALSISPFRDRIAASVEPIKNIMLALLFLSVGLSIDPEIVASAWAPLLLNTLVIPVVKFGIILLLAVAGGLQRSEALKLSVALARCGEFGFVLFAVAQARGLMSPRLTALASILITISMLATSFLVRYGERWSDLLPQIRGATGRMKDGFPGGRYFARIRVFRQIAC